MVVSARRVMERTERDEGLATIDNLCWRWSRHFE
jgi:hypothetical protein